MSRHATRPSSPVVSASGSPWPGPGGAAQGAAAGRAFGALDAQVRKELRRWLRELHDELHVTSLFVTHDQEEALEVADRVVLMNAGR